jgi:hypothetical protein
LATGVSGGVLLGGVVSVGGVSGGGPVFVVVGGLSGVVGVVGVEGVAGVVGVVGGGLSVVTGGGVVSVGGGVVSVRGGTVGVGGGFSFFLSPWSFSSEGGGALPWSSLWSFFPCCSSPPQPIAAAAVSPRTKATIARITPVV